MAHRPTRARQSRRAARLDFAGLEIVGALLTPDIVARLAAFEANDQTVEGYEIPPGLKLRDEIARYYRIGEALWSRFETSRGQSAAASERFVLDLLRQCFGFASLAPQSITRIGEREFPVRQSALGGRVPIVVAPAQAEGARRSGVDESLAQFGDSSRRRSATLLLQEYLNAREDAAWGLVSDGVTLRVMRDNISLTRPAWIEANLSKIFSEGLFPDFSALWLLIHQSRFGQADAAVSDCALERWRERGRTDGVAARDKLRQGVEAALLELGQGFIENPANGALRQALTDGALTGHAYFEQLLRVIYRLIFIFAAEDRGLLHPAGTSDQARRVYAEGYSLARLRERSMRRTAWDRHADTWEGLKATFRALMRGQEQLGLPALGGLFAHGVVPDLENARIENRRLLAAIWRLAWLRPDGQPLTRVNWRDMETEELGSVYESLLELTPRASADTRTFTFAEGNETHGNARKTSGSYYTPDGLVKLLLDSTLEPVLDAAEARNTADPAAEILKLSIIDPACGSGHFLLGAARRAAARIAKHRSPGAPSQVEFQHAMREVVSRCIYGVDRNPMAVELCKVALWIETVEPGKPLGFLDANLRCGDSLLGVFDLAALAEGIPDAAYKPLAGDNKATARFFGARNRDERRGQGSLDFARGGGKLPAAAPLAQARAALRALPEDSPEQIAEKRRKYEAAQTDRLNYAWGEAADLYIAAFLLPKTGDAPALGQLPMVPTTGDVWRALADKQVHPPLVAHAMEVSRDARAFHWPLEFPDMMARGGFDVVLGNPPWDTMSPDAKEFFSPHDGQVRFMSPDDQKARIAELLKAPGLAEAWDVYCHRLYALASFFKESGRYKLFAEGNLGKGDFNIYRMFTELALRATRPQGRAAQFVPENLYNGANAAAIRRYLFDECRLDRLVAFENTRKVWFDIDTRAKFCLYVAAPGGKTATFRAAFGVNSTEKLAALSAGLPIEMPVSLVEEFSPEAFAIAEVAHPSDIVISRKLYARLPKFGAELPGSATREYMREIDMGNDREDFEDDPEGVPLYEGRMVDLFDHRAKMYVSGRGRSAVWQELPFGSATKGIGPQWRITHANIPDKVATRWQEYRIGFCDVASPTNQRALVAALIPHGTICGDKVPTVLFRPLDDRLMLLWLGIANSFCLDFLARKKVALKMSYTLMDSLPLPRGWSGTRLDIAISQRTLILTATGTEMTEFWSRAAPQVGLSPEDERPCEDPVRRSVLRAELDVLVARDFFGLTRDEMRYLLDPADILGSDCGFETFGALKRAEARASEGRFTSRDLILDTWDRLSSNRVVDEPVVLRQAASASPSVLQDGAWARPMPAGAGDVGAMLAAILKTIAGPMPARQVRLAATFGLEPRLLLPHLDPHQAAEWQRLIGAEAAPLTSNAASFAPRADRTWGSAVTAHRGNGRLVENLAAGTWAPGSGLDAIDTTGWPDGRAGMLMRVLPHIATDAVISAMPAEIRGWINAAAA
jgi:hypothetical protein